MSEQTEDLTFQPALEQARAVRERTVSCVELVDAYLSQIERLNEVLNAYVTVAADQARAAAEAIDEGLTAADDGASPLHGVPIAIKDLTCTAGIKTTFASRLFADYIPDFDDYVVRRIRDAGCVILGKTNTPEFGALPVTESEMYGYCRNPWDRSKTPGGSSGGSAAAVAGAMAAVGHGTDGGGSVRIPASCCGLFGLKPSRGRISLGPRLGEAIAGHEVNGFMARAVADVAALLDIASGYEAGDPYWLPLPETPFVDAVKTPPERLRIALCVSGPLLGSVHQDCVAATLDAACVLEGLGHSVEEAAPSLADDFVPFLDKLWAVAAAYFADASDADRFEAVNRRFTDQARSTPSFDYVRATVVISRVARAFVRFWDSYDVLLTPTLSRPPVPVEWYSETALARDDLVRDHSFVPLITPLANVTGQPAASVPTWWNEEGLPIGVQLIGPPAGDALVLRIAASMEAARPWAAHRPPNI